MAIKHASALLFICSIFQSAVANEFLTQVPCATVLKYGVGLQVIPEKGMVETRFQIDQPVECGSMVITHSDSAWIRLQDQTVIKIRANSFFELSKEKANSHRLYRGEMMVSAPPGVPETSYKTPNAEVAFKGGMAWIDYSVASKETSAASFNRSFVFRNKFEPEAKQIVNVGEISRLSVAHERVVPTQPVVMSTSSVRDALVGFDLIEEDKKELVEVVQRVFENRAKSLTAEIEDWNEIEQSEPASRSVASVKKSAKAQPAIDPEEARFSMELLKKHLYGEDEDLRMLNEGSRKPAAVQKLDDSEYDAKKNKKKRETQRLIDEVSKMQ